MTIHRLAVALALAFALSGPALAATPVPYTFTAGTPAKADQVNANFGSVVTQIGSVQSDVTTLQSIVTSLQNQITAAMPAGTVLAFAGENVPAGFLLCDGQEVSRETYGALYSAIGTKYGSRGGVNGSTFNVPDLRGMFVRGKAPANVTFDAAGVNTVTSLIFAPGHGFTRSGIPVRFTSTGTLPTGFSTANTTFWIVLVNADTFAVASSEANALAGTPLVAPGTAGSGTHTAVQWIDPDATSRTALAPGGASGNSVGAKQEDELKTHHHVVPGGILGGGQNGSSGTGPYWVYNPPTTDTGGNETRPRNLTLNYIIKY